uniref:Beta-defensin-like domain-containing protein n=1 Tax=Meleagris gallopavo TaxID=9103 RepID=A0A803Y4W4_MELGA
MRILYLLLAVLLVVLQGVAGQPLIPNTMHTCSLRRGVCRYGRCPVLYYQIGSCGAVRSSCCVRYVEVQEWLGWKAP